MNNAGRISLLYIAQQIILSIIVSISAVVIMNVWHLNSIFTPTIISAIYSILLAITSGLIWYKVAKSNKENLPTYYTASSGFRLLLALLVMFIYYMVRKEASMTVFFLVFMAFYVVQLIHHSIFFAKISNHI